MLGFIYDWYKLWCVMLLPCHVLFLCVECDHLITESLFFMSIQNFPLTTTGRSIPGGIPGSGANTHPALRAGLSLPGPGGAASGGVMSMSVHPALKMTSSAAPGSASAPQRLQSNAVSKSNTHLLPIVNEKEGVKQYFRLIL